MARTEAMFVSWTVTVPRNWRLFLVVFLVKMWRLNACPRLTEPLARTRKRFAADFLVFILGMVPSILSFNALSGGFSPEKLFVTRSAYFQSSKALNESRFSKLRNFLELQQ